MLSSRYNSTVLFFPEDEKYSFTLKMQTCVVTTLVLVPTQGYTKQAVVSHEPIPYLRKRYRCRGRKIERYSSSAQILNFVDHEHCPVPFEQETYTGTRATAHTSPDYIE